MTTPLFGEPTTELFRLLSPAFVIAAVGIVPLAMLERRLDFRRISIIEIAGVLAGALTSVALAWRAERPGLRARRLAGMVAWAGLLVVFGPSVLPRWRPRQMREIARFGLPAGAAEHGDGRLRQHRLPDSRREAESGAGRLLLPRLHARGPIRDQDQHIISRSPSRSTRGRRTSTTCGPCARG